MTNKLTLSSALKTVAPKPGRYSDGRNLYLSVSNTGAKSWVFMFQANGRQREIGLGSATGAGSTVALSLNAARLAADRVRAEIAAGIDVIAARVAAKVASVTFGALLLEQIAILSKDWKGDEQANEWLRSMTTHAAKLLVLPVSRIDTDMVVSVLKPIWSTIPVTAERIRYRIEQVMQLAITKQAYTGANPARYAGHIEKLVGKRPNKKGQDNHAALPHAQLPALMATLGRHTGMASKALAFTVLTAVRSGEALGAQWSEFDFAAGTWTIPADRMKAGVMHIVPLSKQALAILNDVRVAGSDFVFTGKNGQLGATALSDKLTDAPKKGGLGLRGVATVHGMRSTFRDWTGDETTFAAADIEMCLAHGLDAVEGAYRRATAVEKRRAIMQAWGDFATGVEKVAALRVAA